MKTFLSFVFLFLTFSFSVSAQDIPQIKDETSNTFPDTIAIPDTMFTDNKPYKPDTRVNTGLSGKIISSNGVIIRSPHKILTDYFNYWAMKRPKMAVKTSVFYCTIYFEKGKRFFIVDVSKNNP